MSPPFDLLIFIFLTLYLPSVFSWNPTCTTQTAGCVTGSWAAVGSRETQRLMESLSAHGHAGKSVTCALSSAPQYFPLSSLCLFCWKNAWFCFDKQVCRPSAVFQRPYWFICVCIKHYETPSPRRALSRTPCHRSFGAPQGVLKHIKRPLAQIQDAWNLTALNKCKCSMPEEIRRSLP